MPKSGIQFLISGHFSTQFFDDFSVIFPYLSKIRKNSKNMVWHFFCWMLLRKDLTGRWLDLSVTRREDMGWRSILTAQSQGGRVFMNLL